jgi:HEAT repeat protein
MASLNESMQEWQDMLASVDRGEQLRALTAIRRNLVGRIGKGTRAKGAARCSGEIRSDELTEMLHTNVLDEMKSPHPEIRAEATLAIASWRDERTIEALKRALKKDTDEGVRLAAVESLSLAAPTASAQDLLVDAAQTDRSSTMRAHAVATLGTIAAGDWAAGPTRSVAGPVRARGAVKTAGTVSGGIENTLEKIEKGDESPYVRLMAARARGTVGRRT